MAGGRTAPGEAASQAEFVRPRFAFEREFGQFRNWWARDRRIVGNPMSILMYLVSHDRGYRLTQQRVRSDLGLGRDAFLAARRRLEVAGFLEASERRHPAGAADRDGRPLGGRRYIVYTLLDPDEPAHARGKTREEACAENPPRPPQPDPEPVDNLPPMAGNPGPGDPPPREDQTPEDQSSSRATAVAAEAGGGDDDSAIPTPGTGRAAVLCELDPGLHAEALLRRLTAAGVDPGGVDLARAAADALSGAARRVGDPAAYVAAADVREAKARGLIRLDWPDGVDLPADIAARLARTSHRETD